MDGCSVSALGRTAEPRLWLSGLLQGIKLEDPQTSVGDKLSQALSQRTQALSLSYTLECWPFCRSADLRFGGCLSLLGP